MARHRQMRQPVETNIDNGRSCGRVPDNRFEIGYLTAFWPWQRPVSHTRFQRVDELLGTIYIIDVILGVCIDG